MIREDARDAVMNILFEEAPDSPRYMGNGGPEVVADLILERLAPILRFSRKPRPETSVWLVAEYGSQDDSWAFHKVFRSLDTAGVWADEAARRVGKDSVFHLFQHWVQGDIAEDDHVYLLVEIDEGDHSIGVENVFIDEAEALVAAKARVIEWGEPATLRHDVLRYPLYA